MESVLHMAHHGNTCGSLLMQLMKFNHVIMFIHVTYPCLHPSLTFVGVIPSFVDEDYYCETGSRLNVQQHSYFDDHL